MYVLICGLNGVFNCYLQEYQETKKKPEKPEEPLPEVREKQVEEAKTNKVTQVEAQNETLPVKEEETPPLISREEPADLLVNIHFSFQVHGSVPLAVCRKIVVLRNLNFMQFVDRV